MGAIANHRPPAARRVGLRIRVKPQHVPSAAMLFERAGFQAIHREDRTDGAVSFWFSKEDAGRMQAVVTAIPVEFYALRAVIGSVR